MQRVPFAASCREAAPLPAIGSAVLRGSEVRTQAGWGAGVCSWNRPAYAVGKDGLPPGRSSPPLRASAVFALLV